VVTGLGLVTPVGTDVDSTWSALLAGTSGAAPITKFDPQKLSVRFACEVKGFDPLKYIDRKEARRYDLFAQFALAAAHQAVTQAGLEGKFPSPERTGVIIGSGIGGMQTYEDNCTAYILKGPDRVSPFFVPMFIPDIAAGLVSIRYGLKGPNYATVSACASSAHAIGDSFHMIRNGVADAMVQPQRVPRNGQPAVRSGPGRVRARRRRRHRGARESRARRAPRGPHPG
jgi:3-oxoacyl-[acyl-carrier-protein] synthase II